MVDATRMSTSLLIYYEQRTKELPKVLIMEHQYFNSKWSISGYIFIYRETRMKESFGVGFSHFFLGYSIDDRVLTLFKMVDFVVLSII